MLEKIIGYSIMTIAYGWILLNIVAIVGSCANNEPEQRGGGKHLKS